MEFYRPVVHNRNNVFCVACGRDVQTSVYSQERASENVIRDTEQSGENTEQEREAAVQQATAQEEIHSRNTKDTQKDKNTENTTEEQNIQWLLMQDIRRMEIHD